MDKAIRTMSVIGIVMGALCFFIIASLVGYDTEAAAGWGILVTLYLLASSITCFVSNKNN